MAAAISPGAGRAYGVARAIMTILHAIAKERGRAVLVVTHDPYAKWQRKTSDH